MITDINFSMNQNHYTLCAFVDYRKAFDCVNFEILISKLIDIGVSHRNIKWFENYFENRTQSVKASGHISECLPVSCGVPQGSVHGPLMFLIYVNDLPNLRISGNILMYADDVALYISGPNLSDLKLKFMNDLQLLSNWSNFNRLSINFTKPKFMCFSSRGLLRRITIPNALAIDSSHNIDYVPNYSYLGVLLDPELNFEVTAKEVVKRVNHKLYLLSLIRKNLPTFGAILLYKTMVLPYFNYSNFLLHSCSAKT